ncbi:MAG: nucleoside diphosphate kinase regulator [Reyranellaceae bacterium]
MASQNKPSIAICESDHDRLSQLAERSSAGNPAVADILFAELDRARVVPDGELAPSVVRMGSKLRYRTDAGGSRAVQLVYPPEADIDAGRISILTPIGAALIGLAPGQSIDWRTVDGRTQVLTVESVAQA